MKFLQIAASLSSLATLSTALIPGRFNFNLKDVSQAQRPFISKPSITRSNFPDAPQTVRIEITSPSPSGLEGCSLPNDKFHSGYAHYANATTGSEDKHLFFAFFEARGENAVDKPVLLTFGGGPGTSGLLNSMSGLGPCIIVADGVLGPSKDSWLDIFNLVAIDYPVGVGYSYAEPWALRNTSESASWDADDFLQAFFTTFPKLAKNKFMLFSGSYGGIYIPNLVKVIHERNISFKYTNHRIPIYLESVVMTNACSDEIAQNRWLPAQSCGSSNSSENVFDATGCAIIQAQLPVCQDALDIAYSTYGNTLENRMDAMVKCADMVPPDHLQRNYYDRRIECKGLECVDLKLLTDAFPQLGWYEGLMNSTRMRKAFGVPASLEYLLVNVDNVTMPFTMSGDLVQDAAKLLEPAVQDGLRVMVINGIQDCACHWLGDISWFKRLNTPHRQAFVSAPELDLAKDMGGFGSVQKVGEGAGLYTFVKMQDSGHFVEFAEPRLMHNLMDRWIKNQIFS